MVQYAVPIADIQKLNWAQSSGDGDGDAFDELDEGVISGTPDDDATDWFSNNTGAEDSIRCQVTALVDPWWDHTNHKVYVRVRANSGHIAPTQLSLYQGAVQIATMQQLVNVTWTTVTLTLSEAEAATITDYTDLRIDVHRYSGTDGDGNQLWCSAMEFECPDGYVFSTAKMAGGFLF